MFKPKKKYRPPASILIDQDTYYHEVVRELGQWQKKMQKKPNLFNKASKGVQNKINKIIPEKVHQVITTAIKQMVRGVLYGAKYTTKAPEMEFSLKQAEYLVQQCIKFYSSSAAVEGAVTGAGGILWGLSDFPLWLSLKMKMLFEIATKYGMDTADYRERLFILHIFQLTFSSKQHRLTVYDTVSDWHQQKDLFPDDIHEFDWRTFQLEYRDYLDLAKLFQMIPGVGAVIGAYVNHRLTRKLGVNAMNAYRMRLLSGDKS